ncbi:ribosome biogenesis GTPase Der [Candidatus Mesenet endosymbiont of Agriotes lineatus]|uniref:ribosome biogenesis GTPase Der n=1 Tax=Candidatus Mesenet endosymbiont of Agriotes lineatus TaxID=3077948 RepID=UPI0030CC71C6
MFKIAIIGLPNAGKSTLFNRLIGRKSAIVSSIAGVTRDRREGIGGISDLSFKLVDTGGWDEKITFSQQVMEQLELAIGEANLIFFLIDANLREQNKELAKWLKKRTKKPIILIANKCESEKSCDADYLQHFDFLGPVYISAEHNLGMADLYEVLSPIISEFYKENTLENSSSSNIRIAIVGRPNVGKSTFLNSILGSNRVITDEKSGTTRDPIDTIYSHNGHSITLIDTAGIRKKTQIIDDLEATSVKNSLDIMRRSHIVILLLDSVFGIERQDLHIGAQAMNEGRGLVIVLNKWDLINSNDRKTLLKFIKQYEVSFSAPIITTSALKNARCTEVIDKCLKLYTFFDKRISTSMLNKWFAVATQKHSPPLAKGKLIKLKYITQVSIRPPAFVIMCNTPENLEESYKRYLLNSLRETFYMEGIPMKIIFKKSKNPYLKNSNYQLPPAKAGGLGKRLQSKF